MAKLRVGLLYGGRSVEHEVSLSSATSILGALDPDRYEIALIAVDPEGRWRVAAGAELIPGHATHGTEVHLPALPGAMPEAADGTIRQLDVIFPIIHGRGGEDGQLQGLLELAEIPYVGAGVLASAVQMDKDVAKRLLTAAGLPVVPDVVQRGAALLSGEGRRSGASVAIRELGLPLFVKPANSGSSVGISKAHDHDSVVAAIEEAARYDTKVLIERAVNGREIEVGVLGNESPEASVPGEICPQHEFYDYDAKYLDESTDLLIPAPLPEDVSKRIRAMAVDAFRVLEGEGIARVDFFVERETGEIFINDGYQKHNLRRTRT